MSVFEAIEQRFRASQKANTLAEALERWRVRQAALSIVPDFDQLVSLVRCSSPVAGKETVIAALCREAADSDEDAKLTLAWVLLPALRRAARALAATTTMESDDLHAEMLLGLWSEIPKVRMTDNGVIGRLLNRARWCALEASLQALARDTHEELVADHSREEFAADLRPSGDASRPEPAEIVQLAVRENTITAQEAEMVMARRREIRELCAEWGISLYAFQCRRRRALSRLRTWFRSTRLETDSA